MRRSDLFTDDQTRLTPRPFNMDFYSSIIPGLASRKACRMAILNNFEGMTCDMVAGELIRITLLDVPQIVNFFAFNAHDPDERYWAHNTLLSESLFLTRYSRLWGTMARNRPLLTILEETVTPPRREGAVFGRHHPAFGGSGTPADWRFAGGASGVSTTWEQLVSLITSLGLSASLIMDDVCFFQKVAIEPYTSHVLTLPSDALAGDRVTLFAEIDVTILLALSPYLGGSLPPGEIVDPRPGKVEVAIMERLATPLPWPYPGEPYPDLALYVDETGTRSDEPSSTPGL